MDVAIGIKMQEFKLSKSPFCEKQVFVSGGLGGYENARQVLSKLDLSVAKGKRVLLKPNAGRLAHPGSGVNTSPEVVAAAIDAFNDAGAIVAIGESPITGVKTPEAYDVTGIASVANERDCPLIDMDARKYVDIALPEGIAIDRLKLCPDMFDFDIVVSIPVMKMHMHTGVTLGIKNMKGCLWRRSKVALHMLPPVDGYDDKPLDIAISDMAFALRPHLTLIDGSIGLEGIGPSAGVPKHLDVSLVGTDVFEVDAIACELMGVRAMDIPHLRLGAERGYGNIDIEKIDVSPSDWRKWSNPFEKPPTDISIGFPLFNILDENSCSACQSSLLLFLKCYGEKILKYFPANRKIDVAIGKGHAFLPPGTLCIGNCTAKQKADNIYVKGCPPVGSEILRAITGNPIIDEIDARPEETDE